MTRLPGTSPAPRSDVRAGARGRCARRALVAATLVAAAPVAGQEPPDSLQAADTTVTQALDEALADSVSADTIFHNLPSLDHDVLTGFAAGVWEWDREDLMASGANSLAELIANVPGLIALWGGDYGTPASASAFGLGSGAYRVFRDGFEVYPLEGGVTDLQHVSLVGVSRVRLDRSMGAMRIETFSHEYDDGRPFSVVEAGTGDLDTNILRGVFADPTALGGSLAVGLERADTRGVAPDEGGNRTGSWARYQLHLRDRGGIGLDYRRAGSQTKVPGYAPELSRTDVTLRARYALTAGLVAEAYTGESTLDAEGAGSAYGVWGGSRSQHGLRLALEAGPVWARGSARFFGGDELPSRDFDVEGGLGGRAWGGVTGAFRHATWMGASTSHVAARAWLGPIAGVSAFGSFETGTYGGRDRPVLDGMTDPPPPSLPQPADPAPAAVLTDRTALRVGGTVSLVGVHLSGALLRLEADRHAPLGLELDLDGAPEPGLARTGFEGWTSLPTPLDGLRLEGSYQRWDVDGPYLPRQIYRAYFQYHRVMMESGNFELWWTLGVRGHDPMSVFVAADGQGGTAGLQTVPFYQNWFFRIQARIVTVRLFFGWDNFTLRQNLQSFPGRRLPFARTSFALRWDLWN